MKKVDLIKKIHTKNTKIVLAIAGGGSEVIGELLRHGQGSNTLLEAVVPYSKRAYEEFIGGAPDKFVSEEAAAQLAMAAYQRAKTLQGSHDVIGIGCTCALAKENERAGREHRVWIARQASDHCITLGFNVNGNREEEETLVSDCIINEIAMGAGILKDILNIKSVFQVDGHKYTVPPEVAQLYTGTAHVAYQHKPKLILPGSFNPIHNGHILMARIASDLCPNEWRGEDNRVHFELSVRNVDKPWLTYKSNKERVETFLETKNNSLHKPYLGDLIFTNAPLFVEKAELFPGCVFVVGYDTFVRINTPKYYKSKADMEEKFAFFHDTQVKWIVFPRKKIDGTMSNEDDIKCLLNPSTPYYCPVFIVPNDIYPEEIKDISSTAIRKAND